MLGVESESESELGEWGSENNSSVAIAMRNPSNCRVVLRCH